MSFWSNVFGSSRKIHEAAQKGNLELVRELLKDNPDLVFSKDDNGRAPLHSAAANGYVDVVKALLVAKADVNAKAANGATALIMASQNGRLDVVRALLAAKADVNARKNDGETPLHTAYSNADVTKLLLANGADVNARRNDGKTPLHLATLMEEIDTAELLRQHSGTDDSAVNLERWKSTAEPEAWVRKHLQGWNHNDWIELLASLRKSQNWPMDEAAIGQHLEMLRAKLRTTEVKESPTREESAPFIEAIRKGDTRYDLPSGSMLEKLPLWAIVHFACKSMRAGGVQFANIATNVPKKHISEIERALSYVDATTSTAGIVDATGECAIIANNLFYVAYNIENHKGDYYLGASIYGVNDGRAAETVLAVAYGALSAAYANSIVHCNVAHRTNIGHAHDNAEACGYTTFENMAPRKACAYAASLSASYACDECEKGKGIVDHFLAEVYENTKKFAELQKWNDETPVSNKTFESPPA